MKEIDFERELLRLAENTNGKVQDLFTKYIGELAALGVHSTKGKEGFFHFEDDIPKMLQPKVNEIMSRFNKDLLSELRTGVDAAVGVSESKHTDVIKRMFDSPLKLSEPRKKEAREAFVNERMKPAGKLALSDRVWNFTSQGKAEVEAAISQAIEDGVVEAKSAAELGRSVRRYLNDPDSMYRRYHRTKVLADGTKKDVIVWKKRVIGEDGKVHFVDTELESVGQGVYRSARANAERCTRSEINGAYRYADYERWNEEPFVIGIKIGLSNNHTVKKEVRSGKRIIKVDVPLKDICDDLAGIYPKTFKWAGWHPHCRCHAVPVMADKADRQQWLAEGCPDHYFDDKQIKDVPESMRQWWRENGDRAMRAKSVPFWIQDNMKGAKSGTPEFLGFKVPKQKMTIELLEKNGWKVDLLGGAKFEGMVEDFDFVSFGKQFDAFMDERKIPRYTKPLSSSAKSVRVMPNGNFVFEIEYLDVDLIRTFSKNGDKLTVLHDLFTVSKAYQGKGFSKDVFGALYSEYQKLGVSEIKVHANINVGGYTWAKYGFTMDVNQAKGLCGRLRTKVSTKKELLKIVEDFEKANPGERFPMNLLTKHPGAKDALLGSDWLGVLDLKNESQRALFESYIGLLPNASAAKAKKTPLEIAFERHSKRTPESIAETMKRWNKRINDRTKNELRELLAEVEKSDFTKKIKHDIGQLYVDKRTGLYHAGKVEDIKRRLNIAKAATERHATRDAEAIQQAWTNSRKKSIAQIAKERHDARTPEYIEKVQRTWNQRRLEREKFFSRYVRIENGEIKDKITDLMNELFKRETETKPLNEELFNKTRALFRNAELATQRHKTRNSQSIQSAWDKRKAERIASVNKSKVVPTKAIDSDSMLRVDSSITIEHYDLKKIDNDKEKVIALIKEYRNMVKDQKYLDWLSRVENFVTLYPSQSKKYVRKFSGDVKRFNISEKVDALKSMSKKDLNAIPVFWRERYNELINRINAFDFGNGAHIDIKSTVDEAYNIYKLSTTKECIAFGLENISTKMPYNIFTKLEKAVPGISKRVPGKEFWDLMPEHYPMIVEASSKGSSYCSFTFKFVEIQNAQRLAKSQYYQSGLLSHEYGHALDNMLGLNKNSKIRDAFEALKKKYFTQTIDLKMLARKYYENNRSGDALEQLCMLSDLVECFSDGRFTLGFGGHGRSYFKSGEKGILEFLAHCSTLQFSGDCEALRTVWKEGYDDMIELFKTLFNL